MNTTTETQERLISCLKSLGLTKYEALVYIALLRVISATASEIHGISGVPRASVYPVIDQLIEKNLVSVSQSSPKRFAAVPPEEGITLLSGRIELDAEYALKTLSSIHRENREEREDLARFILRIKHELGMTMVWIEHDMQLIADLADRIHVLDYGRTIAEGVPEAVLSD